MSVNNTNRSYFVANHLNQASCSYSCPDSLIPISLNLDQVSRSLSEPLKGRKNRLSGRRVTPGRRDSDDLIVDPRLRVRRGRSETSISASRGGDYRHEEIVLVKGKREKDFNSEIEERLNVMMLETTIPVPTRKVLELEVRKCLRQVIERYSLHASNKKSRNISKSCVNKLLFSNRLVYFIYERVRCLCVELVDLQLKKGCKTEWSETLEGVLKEILKKQPYPGVDEKDLAGKSKAFLRSFDTLTKKNKDLRAYLIGKVFKTRSNYEQVVEFVERLFKSPGILNKTAEAMVKCSQIESAKQLPRGPYIWEEREGANTPLMNITDVLRSFIPSGTPLMGSITVNSVPVDLKMPGDDLKTNQATLLKRIVLALYRSFDQEIKESTVESEVALFLEIGAVHNAEIQEILTGQDSDDAKISKLKGLLTSPAIDWGAVGSIALPKTVLEFKKQILDSSLFWLPIMRLGTAECFGHGNVLSHHLFPGIYSIPFTSKPLRGVELDITINSKEHFFVTQTRNIALHLRSQPDDADRFKGVGDPLADISFKWMVSPAMQPSYQEAKWIGELNVDNVKFYSSATLDEQDMITGYLRNPRKPVDDWEKKPNPVLEPQFLL